MSLPANAGDAGSIPELRRFPGEGNGNPLQYSCLGNPTDSRVWLPIVLGVTWDTTEQLKNDDQLISAYRILKVTLIKPYLFK